MKNVDFGRCALGLCVATALLAGCGGSQPPIGAPGAMPQGHAVASLANKSVSGELVYASEIEGSEVVAFSYPKGRLVQTLTGFFGAPYYICSDASGDVFVPATDLKSPGYIYEFAHGGSQPIETLTDPGPGYAMSCSVDPTTGDLEVANVQNVVVYPGGQGTPTVYEASDVGAWDCAYDDSGDLFVDGHTYDEKIAELPAGGTSFSDIALSEQVITGHLQWWDKRLLIEEPPEFAHGAYEVFQVRVSGSSGIVSGPAVLYGKNKHRGHIYIEFAASANSLVMPDGPGYGLLNLWHYPKGGNPYKALDSKPRDYAFYGVAISK
jgi:hypothetical protein